MSTQNRSFSSRARLFLSRWSRLLLRSKTGTIGAVIVFLILILSLFAPVLAPNDPTYINPGNMLLPPCWEIGGKMEFPLGTDSLGRCILSRIIYGTRVSMLIGVCSVIVAGLIGTLFGVVAGYYGGIADSIIMRITDAFHAIPRTLLAMVVVASVSGGVVTLIFVIGFTGWIQYARLIRSEVLTLKSREFVKASVTIGASNRIIIFRHILPNIMSSFIVVSTLSVATSIIAETSLSFLGLGIQAPTISWGGMLSDGRNYLATNWWIATFPGIAITVSVLGIMFLGNWIRDVLDPHNQGLQ